jgi:hypothetical protein
MCSGSGPRSYCPSQERFTDGGEGSEDKRNEGPKQSREIFEARRAALQVARSYQLFRLSP